MKRNKEIIIILIFGIFILALIFGFILKTLKDISKSSQNLISQNKELKLLEIKTAAFQKFDKEYKINKENLEKIDKLFLNSGDPRDLVDFFNFLKNTAATSGVSINISPPQKEEKKGTWSCLTFQISIKGNFTNLMGFLKKLENSPYLINISNISMTAATNLPASEINANLMLNVFVR